MNALETLIAEAFERAYSFKVTSITPTEDNLGYFRIEYEFVNSKGMLETEVVGQSATQITKLIRDFFVVTPLRIKEIEA